MSARDDFGSSAGRGPSSGGLGNGGIGGGMGAGSRGGGAGYNGGAGSRTGLTTGTEWKGNTAFGRPGSMATGYATRDAGSLGRAGMGPTLGSYGQFKTMSGNPMFAGLDNPMRAASGFNAQQAAGKLAALQARQQRVGPTAHPGVDQEMSLPTYDPTIEPVPQPYNPVPPKPTPRASISTAFGFLPGWPGTGQWWGDNGANWKNNQANWPRQSVPGTRSTNSTDESGSPSLDPKGSYPPGYASGGLVRSAMLTAKGVSNGMKGALVVNQKGNVVSGKLKSGPIVQVGLGGAVMKRGTVKITWGS